MFMMRLKMMRKMTRMMMRKMMRMMMRLMARKMARKLMRKVKMLMLLSQEVGRAHSLDPRKSWSTPQELLQWRQSLFW